MNGIIFIVDAADRTRFQEAKDELQGLLESQELAEVFVVVVNLSMKKKKRKGEHMRSK